MSRYGVFNAATGPEAAVFSKPSTSHLQSPSSGLTPITSITTSTKGTLRNLWQILDEEPSFSDITFYSKDLWQDLVLFILEHFAFNWCTAIFFLTRSQLLFLTLESFRYNNMNFAGVYRNHSFFHSFHV